MVIVKVFGNLKAILRVPELEINIGYEDKTVNSVLNILMKQFGDSLRRELLDSTGKVKAAYSIFINGKDIVLSSGLSAKLEENDTLVILPVVEGG
jgi:MoaD family protein